MLQKAKERLQVRDGEGQGDARTIRTSAGHIKYGTAETISHKA